MPGTDIQGVVAIGFRVSLGTPVSEVSRSPRAVVIVVSRNRNRHGPKRSKCLVVYGGELFRSPIVILKVAEHQQSLDGAVLTDHAGHLPVVTLCRRARSGRSAGDVTNCGDHDSLRSPCLSCREQLCVCAGTERDRKDQQKAQQRRSNDREPLCFHVTPAILL